MDESSPVGWEGASVIRRLGVTGFDEVLEGLVAAPTWESRCWVAFAFSRYGIDALDLYTAALSHREPVVRKHAAAGIQYCDTGGLPAAPALLPLLGDPDDQVVDTAQTALRMLGPPVVPMLQRVRRDGPGEQRAAALSVLAFIGGEAALSPRDVAAIERLIRVKLLDDRPEPLSGCWNHWIAVHSGDQTGILEILGLVQPRPVTFALANDVVDSDGHTGLDADSGHFARVFVTPELDGWTFVAGRWCDPVDDERSEDVLRFCEVLSARYGQAQAYYYEAQGDGSAWIVAEEGLVIRRYCEVGDGEDELRTLGEPLPYERARRAELGLSPEWNRVEDEDEDDDEWRSATFDMAPGLAEALGVSPLTIGPDTPMRGTGVLALTPYGIAHGVPAGSYRV